MTSRRTVELCYDVVSPWAYIGYSRLMALKQNASKWKEVDITLTPVFLGGVMKLAGNKPPITVPKKFAHMQDDLRRTSQHYGIPFVFPTSFPVMTIGVQRLLTGVKLEHPDFLHSCTKELFEAHFVAGKDMTSTDTAHQACLGAGMTEEMARDAVDGIGEDTVKTALTEATQSTVDRGAFGAPTFFVNGTEMFFGSDRFHLMEDMF
eukprot:TRINITY_DN1468_c0_g4_i3.p1 TRINITY_DN1468_c0_g4~~TRINITY_DN1468_c0_g4_i3.p1  ORF type:complete len:206 (-),score=25.31 TRINITY_DN1468_c0_g4_i3:72-689(-)